MDNNEACSDEPHEVESIANVSQESSPRSVGDTGSISDDQICLKSEDLRPCRVKLLCSYGGKICPRPHDSHLRYVGGETKILVVIRNISFAELMAKLTKVAGRNIVIKYQLPYEDLDALVSVLSDDDVQNMLEEYEKAESRNSLCRLHLFLFANKRQKDVTQHYNGSKVLEQQFADKMNGGAVISKQLQASPRTIRDYPFGLDNASDAATKHSKPFNRGVQRIGLPVANFSSFMALPSSISASVHTPTQKAAAQFYKPPVERAQCFKGHATPQESSFLVASPRSPKPTVPISDLLQSSELNPYGMSCSDVSSPFSQMDLREHRHACTRPLVGVDSGSLSRKPLMDPDSEASTFWINQGRDAKFLAAADAFGVSLPSNFIPQKHYPGHHQENYNQHSDVLQRGNTLREKYDLIYDKPLPESDKVDFCKRHHEQMTPLDSIQNVQKDKGKISSSSQQMHISEASSGVLCRPMVSGDLASSLFQGRSQRQHLHSNSPFNTCHKACLRNYQQQPPIQQNESMSGVCSNRNTEMAVKAMAPQNPASGIRAARPPAMPSKHITLQTGISGAPRQVCQSHHLFPQIFPEETSNGKLSRTSCLNKDQFAHLSVHGRPCSPSRLHTTSPTKFWDHYLHTEEDRFTVHDDPFIDTKTRAQTNTHVTKVYAEQPHNFLCADKNVNGNLWNGFRCNPDVLCQCKDIQGIMETKRHGIYHKVRG